MKQTLSKLHALLAGFAILSAIPSAQATVIIGNYPPNNDDTGTAISTFVGTFSKAAGFTMGAGPDYTLDSVQLRLEVRDVAATMQLSLFGDVGGNPGGPALTTFSIPALSLGFSDYTFIPTASVNLLATTTYWIAATGQAPDPGNVNGIVWRASVPGIIPTGLATDAGRRFDSNGTFPATTPDSFNVVNTYQVNGTAVAAAGVPDSGSSLAMLGLAVAFTGGIRKWIGRTLNS